MAQINKPTEHFNTILYTGDGASSKAITGLNHKPDLVWIKSRSNGDNHNVFDSSRGTGKFFRINNDAQVTGSNNILSFDTDGFTVGTHTPINRNSGTHACWNWKANGGTTSSNTDGSITSTVQANTTAGFSIVRYSSTANADIGHGLGGKPDFIMTKSESGSGWVGWHTGLGGGNEDDRYVYFSSNSYGTTTDYWTGSGTGITSTKFGVNATSYDNNNGEMTAYCFRSIKGYSRFGSYRANGSSTDNAFVYCGFKPGLIWIKGIDADSGAKWYLHDSKRNGINTDTVATANRSFRINAPDSEANASGYFLDILSNGFKIKTSNVALGKNNTDYLFCAFASEPLVGTNNIPSTAR